MEKEKLIHTEVVDIDDLIQDDHNFNKGTEEGARLIERSFKDYGAGRSVLIDRNNRLVGGNKAQKGFKGAGFRKVVIVDSDADTLVAVRRKDVDLDSKEGRDMALLDNLTTQKNLAWDVRAPFTQGGGLRRGCGVKDEIHAVIDFEQADVITLALGKLRLYLYEGGYNGIRSEHERQVQFVDNLILYFKRLKEEYYERMKTKTL